MKVYSIVLLALTSTAPFGHAAGPNAAVPHSGEVGGLCGLQTNGTFSLPDTNGTIAEAKFGEGDPTSACCSGKPKSLMFKLTGNLHPGDEGKNQGDNKAS